MRTVLLLLHRVETQLRKNHPVMRHLDVAFVPVGSVVEGAKVGRPDELDVMVVFRCWRGRILI